MPIVHIDLIAGRSQEQLKNLVKDVTDAVSKNTGAPAEHIHVILSEMQKNRYSVGGVLKERRRSRIGCSLPDRSNMTWPAFFKSLEGRLNCERTN